MSPSLAQALLTPDDLNYSVDLGGMFKLTITYDRLGMEEICSVTGEIHSVICEVVHHILSQKNDVKGYLERIPKEHLVFLQLTESGTGSWWLESKVFLPEQLKDIAKDVGRALVVEVIVTMFVASAHIGIDWIETTVHPQPPVTARQVCDVTPQLRKMITQLSQQGDVTFTLTGQYREDETKCELNIKTKKHSKKRQ